MFVQMVTQHLRDILADDLYCHSSSQMWFHEWIAAPMIKKVIYPFKWQGEETQNVVCYLSPIHDEKGRWTP